MSAQHSPEIKEKWDKLVYWFIKQTGKKPNTNTLLFLIGVQELGKGKQSFSKEEKQDLMHLGLCRVLSSSGFYRYEGHDEDGWPHYMLEEELPSMTLDEQENFIRWHILDYFSDLIDFNA